MSKQKIKVGDWVRLRGEGTLFNIYYVCNISRACHGTAINGESFTWTNLDILIKVKNVNIKYFKILNYDCWRTKDRVKIGCSWLNKKDIKDMKKIKELVKGL